MEGNWGECECWSPACQMKTRTKITLAIIASAGFVWLCWAAVRVRIDSRDYPKLSDVPGFRDCPGVDDVGPVRTIRYRHPHDNHVTGTTWITGEWPGNGFRDVATENQLHLNIIDGESMNQASDYLPIEFKRGLRFATGDFSAAGQICGGKHSLFGTHSAETGRFLFRVHR